MNEPTILVDDSGALLRLARIRDYVFSLHGSRLSLGFALSDETRAYWEGRLNEAYGDCGCGVGAFVVLTCICAYLVGLAVHSPASLVQTKIKVGLGVGIVAFSAVAGKLLGLYWAGTRFRNEVLTFLGTVGRG